MTRLPRLLWWLRPNTFYADNSSVAFIDRFAIRYRERGRSLLIEQDLQSDSHLVAIERGSMRAWEPPHERETISEGEKDRIIENLRRAFATRGYRLMLLDPYLNARSGGHTRDIARR
jgi:immunity protein 74 of polymorphic toxin system